MYIWAVSLRRSARDVGGRHQWRDDEKTVLPSCQARRTGTVLPLSAWSVMRQQTSERDVRRARPATH